MRKEFYFTVSLMINFDIVRITSVQGEKSENMNRLCVEARSQVYFTTDQHWNNRFTVGQIWAVLRLRATFCESTIHINIARKS